MKLNNDVNPWRIYFALTHPEPVLDDLAPIDATGNFKLGSIVKAVCKRIETMPQKEVIAA